MNNNFTLIVKVESGHSVSLSDIFGEKVANMTYRSFFLPSFPWAPTGNCLIVVRNIFQEHVRGLEFTIDREIISHPEVECYRNEVVQDFALIAHFRQIVQKQRGLCYYNSFFKKKGRPCNFTQWCIADIRWARSMMHAMQCDFRKVLLQLSRLRNPTWTDRDGMTIKAMARLYLYPQNINTR